MIRNSKFKNTKDIESAAETVIPNISTINSISNHLGKSTSASVTAQQLSSDNFDTFIEKVR